RFAPASEGGFTLLELTVATVIFSIVIAAAYTLLESARGLTTRAELRAQLFQSARVALQAVEDGFRGAGMPATPSPSGVSARARRGVQEGEPPDRIVFVWVTRHTAAAYDVNIADVVRG